MHRLFDHQRKRFRGLAMDAADVDMEARVNQAIEFLTPKLSPSDLQQAIALFAALVAPVAEDDEAAMAAIPVSIPGGRPRQNTPAMDSAMSAAFAARHPDAGRIGFASTAGDQPQPRTRPDSKGFAERHPDVARIKSI
jgi:hypothetical protein